MKPVRSVRPTMASAIVAAGSLIFASAALKFLDLSAPLRIAVALLPIPGYVWFFISRVRAARCLDELQQRVHLEALVIAFPSTFMGILLTWLLYRAGVLPNLTFSDAVAFFLLLMIGLFVLGQLIAARRYR